MYCKSFLRPLVPEAKDEEADVSDIEESDAEQPVFAKTQLPSKDKTQSNITMSSTSSMRAKVSDQTYYGPTYCTLSGNNSDLELQIENGN